MEIRAATRALAAVGLAGFAWFLSSRRSKTKKDNKAFLRSLITGYPDFPKKGVLFQDIFPVFRNPDGVAALTEELVAHLNNTYTQRGTKIDVIIGLDSRGFLFGPILSTALNCAFVPIRKRHKLPGKVEFVEYVKEYGKEEAEIQADSVKQGQTCVIVDDLLATGGTLMAACDLVRRVGGNVLECLVIIELNDLKGRSKINSKVFSLLEY